MGACLVSVPFPVAGGYIFYLPQLKRAPRMLKADFAVFEGKKL
jgi:hypothetical protein